MEHHNKYWEIGWVIARMTIVSTALAYFAGRYYEKLQHPSYCLFISFIFSISIVAIQSSSHNKKIYIGGFFLFIAGLVLLPKSTRNWMAEEQAYLFLMFVLVFALFWVEKRLYFRVVTAVVIFLLLLISGTERPDYSKMVLGISAFYLFDVVIQVCQRNGAINQGVKITARNLLPIVILTIGICIGLPVKPEPIRWEMIINKVNSIKEMCTNYFYEQYMNNMRIGEEFSIATIGYSENNNSVFGGKLLDHNTIVLRVETGGKIYNRLYLTGTIRDKYTGKGWEIRQENPQEIPEYQLALFERLYGLYLGGLLQLNEKEQYHFENIRIDYGTIKTKSIFYPTNSFNIASSGKNIKKQENGLNFYWDKEAQKGASYFVNMFEVNQNNLQFQEYLKNPIQKQYTTSIQKDFQKMIGESNNSLFVQRLNELLGRENLQELLLARKAEINRKYLQLPDQLPLRIKELAESCTKNSKSDYEKVLALQQYLIKMPYSTEVPKLPKNKDLVDSFLFEHKQGYCTYFASALTVMSRTLGIPARYVEGISVSCGKEGRGVYQVKSAAAHAWVEVYVDGYGWIVVEATPRYGQSQNGNAWVGEVRQTTKPIVTERSTEEIQPELEIVTDREFKNTFIVLIIVVLVFALIAISILLQKWHKKKEYSKAGRKEKFFICMQNILKYLKYMGYPLLDSETIGEYKKRMIHQEEVQNLNWEILLAVFETIRYSEKEPTQSELMMMEETANFLKDSCMKRDGKLRFLVTFF